MWLAAGELSVLYENGFLRYINYGDAELLNMIYFALRDANWGTLKASISDEQIVQNDRSFTIKYSCTHRFQRKIICIWDVIITGKEDGEIAFEISGRYVTNFYKNRSGLCLLHPANKAHAQEIEVIYPDGRIEQAVLPELIAPLDLFKNFSSLRIKKDEYWYRIDLEGDTFEIEDQRNWTDSTFKTFCTPLHLPFPILIRAGDIVRQKVIFTPESVLPKRSNDAVAPVKITVLEHLNTMPHIGVGKSSTVDGELPNTSINLLKKLEFAHYQVDVDMTATSWADLFIVDVRNANLLALPLKVSLTMGDDFTKDIEEFVWFCDKFEVDLHSILLLSAGQMTTTQKLADYATIISRKLHHIAIGIGTMYNYTEINRKRIKPQKLQFISYAIHPQEHAFDDLTIIENIPAQAETVKTAKHIYGSDTEVYITPVTFRRRFNPYVNDPTFRVWSSAQRADPRQKTAMGAVFLLGSIKTLTEAGIKNVTYFQTIGNQGFLSKFSKPYPAYAALKRIITIGAKQVIVTKSNRPLHVDCMLFDNGTILLWNYCKTQQQVLIPDGRLIDLLPLQILTIPPM